MPLKPIQMSHPPSLYDILWLCWSAGLIFSLQTRSAQSVTFTLPRPHRLQSEECLVLSCDVFNHMLEPPTTFSDHNTNNTDSDIAKMVS